MQNKEYMQVIDKPFKEFAGDFGQLEAAISSFMIDRRLDWKSLLLIHDKKPSTGALAQVLTVLGAPYGDWKHQSSPRPA
jgi:hypothetical protein